MPLSCFLIESIMRIACLFSVAIFANLVGCAPKFQAAEDLKAIQAMFRQFRAALNQKNGEEAVRHISAKSIARYEQFRKWALEASPEELNALSIVEQIETLRVRNFCKTEELQGATGRDVIALLINRERLGVPYVESATLGDAVFQEGKCYIHIYDHSGPVKEKMTFLKEQDKWKIDISALEYVHKLKYAGMMRRQRLAPQEVIQEIVNAWQKEPVTGPLP